MVALSSFSEAVRQYAIARKWVLDEACVLGGEMISLSGGLCKKVFVLGRWFGVCWLGIKWANWIGVQFLALS